MDRKFKESSCLKTPANLGLVTQVYRNSMTLFTRYAQSRQQFEIKLMSDIENSLIGALNNLNREKVSFLVVQCDSAPLYMIQADLSTSGKT